VPSARRCPCPVPAARRLLTATIVQSPLRAVRSPPPLSCPRYAPPARRRPCPVSAARRPLATALVLSPLRTARSPPPLFCPCCAPTAHRPPCPVSAACCPLAAALVLSLLCAVHSPLSLSSSCLLLGARLTLRRHTRHHTCHVLLTIVLAASYSLSSSPRPTCSLTRHVLLALILDTSYWLSSTPPASSLPSSSQSSCSSCRAHRVVLTTSGSLRHVVFANFPLFPTLTARLHASKTVAMDVTLGACAGNAKCGSSIYRCTLDIKNRTGLSHYA